MKQTLKLWMLAAILTICGMTVLTSCSSEDNPVDNPTVEEPTLPEARVTETIRYDEAKMTAYNIEYPSTDPYGQPATLSGTITVGDEVTKGESARGLLLYNHYTVNRADECPSRGELAVQKLVVGSGLITVSADYYGFGVTGDKPQAYCVPSANAQASVDALVAARMLLAQMGYTWDDKLFSAGYSQGGQTTIGVLRLVTEKHPDIRFTRSFAGGGPYCIPEIYRQFMASNQTAMPSTVVGVLYSYNDVFGLGISREDIFREPLLSHLDEWLLSKQYKQAEIEALIGSQTVTDFIVPTLMDPDAEPSRRLMEAMQREDLCQGWTPRQDEQLTIVHNASDGAVPVANAERLVEFLQQKGLPITHDYTEPGVYVRLEDFGEISGIAPAHEFGALFFFVHVIVETSENLGIEPWFTPDFNTLQDFMTH